MGSALSRRQAAERKDRKTKEARKAKLNSKVPQLLSSSLWYHCISISSFFFLRIFVFHALYLQLFINTPQLSLSASVSLAFILMLCSAACWLCEELVQPWLKPWQNANVSLRARSVTHRGLASLCLFVCVFVCAWYVRGRPLVDICLCLLVSGCVLPLKLWASKLSWTYLCVYVCMFMFVAHAATRVYEYVFMFAHENVCFKICQWISPGHCLLP